MLGAAQDAHTLAWNPQEGAKMTYSIEMSANIDFGQGPSDLQTNLTLESLIKEVKEDTVTVQGSIKKFELLLGGQDMSDMMPGGEEMTGPVTRVFTKRGALVSSSASSLFDNPRFDQVRVFAYPEGPVKVGESWTNEFKGDKDKKVPPSRGKFTLDGIEKVGEKNAYRVKIAFSELEGEKPMGALGTAWVDQSTGDLVKMDADINDASFAEGMPPMNFKMKVRQL